MGEPITQEQREKSALKSGVWYTVSSISVKAVLIITTPIFTRLMTTADYGTSANFTTWFALLNVVLSLNLWYSVGRAKIDFPGKLEEYVGSMQLLAVVFCFGFGSISLLFLDDICGWLDLDAPMVIALFAYLLVYPVVQLTQAKYKYQYNYKGNVAISIYTTLATTVFSVVLVLVISSNRALGKSLGAVISTGVLAICLWINSIKKGYVKVNLKYWKYGLLISVPLILNSISLNVLSQSDRIFITKYCGSEYTGIYSLAYSYAVLINIVLNSVNEAWLPWFHDTFNDKQYDQIKSNVKPLVIFGCWFGIGCIAIAPEAIALLGGKAYQEGIWVVPPVTLGVICSYIFQHYEHIELHLKKTWYVSVGTVLAAIVNMVLNFFFVKRFGFVAAAYTTLIAYILLMVLHNFITRKVLKVHIYNDRFMYIVFAVTCVIGAVFALLYNAFWLWRWVLIVLLSIVYLFSNRKLLLGVFKRFVKK